MEPYSQGKPLGEVGKRFEKKEPLKFFKRGGGGEGWGVQRALWTTSGDHD